MSIDNTYINKIGIINYDCESYTLNQISELYNVQEPIVFADNDKEFLSPHWLTEQLYYDHSGDWLYDKQKKQISFYGFFDKFLYLTGDIRAVKLPHINGFATKLPYDIPIGQKIFTQLITYDLNQNEKINWLSGEIINIENNNCIALLSGNINLNDYNVFMNGEYEGELVDKKNKIKYLRGIIKSKYNTYEQLFNTLSEFKAWGWLAGGDNFTYTNEFYYNEIQTRINGTWMRTGKVLAKGHADITQQFSSQIKIIINNDTNQYIQGTVVKYSDSFLISGELQGNIVIYDHTVNMKGILTGMVDKNSKHLIRNNATIHTYLNIQYIQGILYNTSPIDQNLHQILDTKQYNALGRKSLIYNNSLMGQKLDFTSKNIDVNNFNTAIQTWKIIKYEVEGIESKTYLPVYNEQLIDPKTRLINAKQLHQKQQYTKKYSNNITDKFSKNEPLQWYGIIQENDKNAFKIYITSCFFNQTNNYFLNKQKQYLNTFIGPCKDLQSIEDVLKQITINRNLVLSKPVTYVVSSLQMKDICSSYFEYNFENSNIDI